MDEETYALQPETAEHFEHVAGAPAVFQTRQHGKIDIRTLTPQTAQALVDAGCAHLVQVDNAPLELDLTGGDVKPGKVKKTIPNAD